MALSLSNYLVCWTFSLLWTWAVQAATVTYDFDIGWVMANPDGMFERPTIGINGQWPLPQIRATVGDRVIVNVNNRLGNQSTTLHFHGLFMNGSTEMDGPAGVSQCGIPPGSSFKYDFTVSHPFSLSIENAQTDGPRLTNLVLTGITRTLTANIQTDCEEL